MCPEPQTASPATALDELCVNTLRFLHNANAGERSPDSDAETTPMRNPEYYQYELDLPAITEVWRRGKVHRYKPGSWGPKQADALIAASGSWHNPIPVKAAK